MKYKYLMNYCNIYIQLIKYILILLYTLINFYIYFVCISYISLIENCNYCTANICLFYTMQK